jgi:hypothetical protein
MSGTEGPAKVPKYPGQKSGHLIAKPVAQGSRRERSACASVHGSPCSDEHQLALPDPSGAALAQKIASQLSGGDLFELQTLARLHQEDLDTALSSRMAAGLAAIQEEAERRCAERYRRLSLEAERNRAWHSGDKSAWDFQSSYCIALPSTDWDWYEPIRYSKRTRGFYSTRLTRGW